ncbi:MAG: photosystem II repair protein Psb32 [Cyanophyceae cyanobacterium]
MIRILLNITRLARQRLIAVLFPVLLVTGTIAAPASATGIADLPNLGPDSSVWVVDQAEVISRINEGQLNAALGDLQSQSGNDVKLVAIRRLDYGETVDSLAEKLFERWFPAPDTQANATLLVLETLTNNVAIRTGVAVKAVMPDNIAQSVAADTIGVPLREGDKYNQAFLAAKDRLVAVLSGQEDPGPPEVKEVLNTEGTFTAAEDTKQGSATVWVVVLLVLATVIPMATYFLYASN